MIWLLIYNSDCISLLNVLLSGVLSLLFYIVNLKIEYCMEGISLFINNLNNSDWIALLGVIVSALLSLILIIATYRIGKVQNGLQEKQNKIASIQIYRALYICLSDVRNACNMFPLDLESKIPYLFDEYENDFCQKDIDKINNLINLVNNYEVDMEIQLTEYHGLHSNIMLMLYSMEMVYSKIKRLKMPSDLEKLSSENIDMLKNIIKENCPDCDINIETITNRDYKDVLHKVWSILIKSTWKGEDYVKSSYADKIKHTKTKLSMLTSDNFLEGNLRAIEFCRNQIFETKNGVMDFLKSKCKL